MTTSSLDKNQKIYISEESREQLFNDIHNDNGNLKKYLDPETLENYCLGKTELSDYAYSHIRALLRKEYKEWCKLRIFKDVSDKVFEELGIPKQFYTKSEDDGDFEFGESLHLFSESRNELLLKAWKRIAELELEVINNRLCLFDKVEINTYTPDGGGKIVNTEVITYED